MNLPLRPQAPKATPGLDNPHDRGNAPSRLPAWLQWTMISGVFAAVALSGLFAVLEHWRRATFVLGAAMLWLAVVRLSCDSSRVGILAVRSRRFDAVYTTALGAAMVFLAVSVDALGS
ncbi:DUF3017 domain-containing protein [Corynebacterium lizhenjunii]|uniref:DUF3017 domain-containing protein n=1 Tax=Corynebacterium lizhenjunii TaxID=2709394 RepID=A0A7T0KGP2_9CORY|nr:DUF3017 domain-containing protein [Corynebacterium lizhenjunii]QPK79639.1 DUF3017 domain-containing protein [Corynebacterium lizhenjunii]